MKKMSEFGKTEGEAARLMVMDGIQPVRPWHFLSWGPCNFQGQGPGRAVLAVKERNVALGFAVRWTREQGGDEEALPQVGS